MRFPKFGRKLALLSVSLLLSLLGVEVGLRAFGAYAPVTMHRLPPNSEFKDVQTDWNITYKTNSLGLRDEEHPLTKEKGVIRVAVIGDSFAFGQGCERGQIFPDVLQSLLRDQGYPVEIMNVSDIGIGPEAYFVLFKEVAARYLPDVIVLNAFGNDASQVQRPPLLNRLTRSASHYSNLFTFLRFLRKDISIRMQGDFWTEVAKPANNNPDDLTQKRVAEFRTRYGSEANNLLATCIAEPDDVARWINTEPNGQGWKEFEDYVLAINEMAVRIHSKVVIAIVPDGAQVDPHQLEMRQILGVPLQSSVLTEKPSFQTLVHQFSERNHIACFDPLEEFRQVRSGLYFNTDLHWTPAGHRLYAEQLAKSLIDLGFVRK
jgi:lysophospholipase L1-like esterase